MTPFTFKDPAKDWPRFVAEAARWKPPGFDAEMQLRLAYYLDDQIDDLRAELKRRFPETHATMTPVALPIVRLLTQEAAKVFLQTTKLEVVEPGQDQPSEALAAWWKAAQEQMGLGLRLKRADAYTWLLRTAGLKIGYDEAAGRFCAHVVFPQSVMVVPDPNAPMDLDRAYGVAVAIASEDGISGGKRWEFWSAREGEGETALHGILTVTGGDEDEKPQVTFTPDEGDPMRGPGGRAMVPLVLFTAHTDELGLFTTENKGLVEANRGLNVLVTDIHHIAEQQGFGVLVLTSSQGEDSPGKIVRAPNTAISLKSGTDAKFINPGAPLADLVQLADSRLKQTAVLRGLPAGAVSVEARAVASGVALQIEMRPLLEQRADAIEVYRDPMRRLWDVIRATHNAYRETPNFLSRIWAKLTGKARLGEIGEDVEMRWTPGDVQLPVDDDKRVDTVVVKLKNDLCSRIEAIAELRGISLDEAKKVAEQIDAERDEEPTPPVLDLADKQQQLQSDPPQAMPKMDPMMDQPPEEKPPAGA